MNRHSNKQSLYELFARLLEVWGGQTLNGGHRNLIKKCLFDENKSYGLERREGVINERMVIFW